MRVAKARVAAKARLRDIFDQNYEPWEEVHDALDQSDSEDVKVDNSFHGGCSGIGAHYHRVQVGGSLRSNTNMEAGDALVAYTLRAGSKSQCEGISFSWVASEVSESIGKSEKFEDGGKVFEQSSCVKGPHPAKYCRPKKKVIMGRDFLLVNRNCLRESDTGRKSSSSICQVSRLLKLK